VHVIAVGGTLDANTGSSLYHLEGLVPYKSFDMSLK